MLPFRSYLHSFSKHLALDLEGCFKSITNTPCFVEKQTLNSRSFGVILQGVGCLPAAGHSKQVPEVILNLVGRSRLVLCEWSADRWVHCGGLSILGSKARTSFISVALIFWSQMRVFSLLRATAPLKPAAEGNFRRFRFAFLGNITWGFEINPFCIFIHSWRPPLSSRSAYPF